MSRREIEIKTAELAGAYTVSDLVNTATGEVIAESNTELTPEMVAKIIEAELPYFDVFWPERDDIGSVISQTVRKDSIKSGKLCWFEGSEVTTRTS